MKRLLVVTAAALAAWAAFALVTGGFSTTIAGIKVASREPVRPLVVAAVLLAIYAFVSRRDREPLRFATWNPTPFVVLLSIVIGMASIRYGTFAASGSDAYGYVSQADLWLRGNLRVEEPLISRMPWPEANWTFAPLGYIPARDGAAIVPSYSPGLPMLMAVGRSISEAGPYYVVPIAGALAVWFSYVLGQSVASPLVGVLAALLFATNPTFVFQLMWPMSDVPVTACWLGVLCFVCRVRPPSRPRRDTHASGGGKDPHRRVQKDPGYSWGWIGPVCGGLAILIRPNLVPLAALVLVFLLWSRGWRHAMTFALATAAASLTVAAINASLYGSPFRSGYGNVGEMFLASNFWPNVRLYGEWLATSQTPAIALAVVGALVPTSHPRSLIRRAADKWLLVSFALAVLLLYVFYGRWDAWWYLRFLMPAFPGLLILMVAGSLWLLSYVPTPARIAVVAFSVTLLVAYQLNFAMEQEVLKLAAGERRYIAAGHYVATHLPPTAVVISMQHSGSVRYYSGRLTLRWDWMARDWLDRAVDRLRAEGLQPFILLDEWEEARFQSRFASTNRIGKLDWPPMAEIPGPIRVHIYDPGQAKR